MDLEILCLGNKDSCHNSKKQYLRSCPISDLSPLILVLNIFVNKGMHLNIRKKERVKKPLVLAEKGKKGKIYTSRFKLSKNLGFTMYFTNSLSISFLANTMDLNYQMKRNRLSSPQLLLTRLWHNWSAWGGNATGTMSGETARKNDGH